MEIIKCQGVSFSYPKTEYPAINNINLSVEQGELCLLIGESAAGKSTLLKLLKKEIAPHGELNGDISVNGTVGYVAQNVDESIVADRVRAELSFGLTNMGMSGDEIELLVAETASYFDLEDKLDADISSLSGGEKQIVNLASVMIMKPDILLLDEPTAQLDPASASKLINAIARLHRAFGITILITEHNLDELIASVDSIAYIKKNDSITKDSLDKMIPYIRQNTGDMADILPAFMRLFDDATTVTECKNKLKFSNLSPKNDTDDAPDIALKAKNISYAYKRGCDVLSDLNCVIYKNKINAILGPNGSGKSTLLKVLSNVKKPYHGRVKCDSKVSYLCQNVTDLFTKEKCADEVEFGEITELLGIDYLADQHPFDLSGGEAQRLAIAKVLQTGADVILLDEPTKGLDPVIKVKLAKLLSDLCSIGKTIVLVSHDIEFVGRYADYVSFLSCGRIVTTAPRRKFFSSLSFYTTQLAKITNGIVDGVVSIDDYLDAGGAL